MERYMATFAFSILGLASGAGLDRMALRGLAGRGRGQSRDRGG